MRSLQIPNTTVQASGDTRSGDRRSKLWHFLRGLLTHISSHHRQTGPDSKFPRRSKRQEYLAIYAAFHGLIVSRMQFNRGARTIGLLRRDGSTLYPLGEQQLQNEPDQYVVLNAIREFIGQVPAAP